jgi:membrane protein YdbS with pleckstrin-like domain
MEPIVIRPNRRLITKFALFWLLMFVLVAVFCGLIGLAIGAEDGNGLTGLLIGVGINVVWIIPALLLVKPYYETFQYEIQDDEVIVRSGIITKSVKHVPYRTITNLEIRRDPFDRLLGFGSLKIQTAGMSGQSGAEENLPGLPEVDDVYQTVVTALRRYRGALPPTQAGEDVVAAPAQSDALGAILEEVRAIRAALDRG